MIIKNENELKKLDNGTYHLKKGEDGNIILENAYNDIVINTFEHLHARCYTITKNKYLTFKGLKLTKHPLVGVWKDNDGKMHIEKVWLSFDKEKAIKQNRKHKQIAMYEFIEKKTFLI